MTADHLEKPSAPRTRKGLPRWVVPVSVVAVIAVVFAVRATQAGGQRSAVLLVGSVATKGFLECQAQVRSDATRDPVVIVVSGGALTGIDVLRDSDSHGLPAEAHVDVVGMSVGPPELERLRGRSGGARQDWVALPLTDRYPLGVVATDDVAPALEAVARPCVEAAPGPAPIARCVRPAALRDLLRNEHLARTQSPAATRSFLLVPDSSGGIWEAVDKLVWPRGQDATPEWIEPDARFSMDFAEFAEPAGHRRAIAFAIPTRDSSRPGPAGAASCGAPAGVRQLGLCDADGDEATCRLAHVSLFAYTRVPFECADGQACRLHDSLCGLMRTIYTRLEDSRGQAWAAKCELAYRTGAGLIRPLD